MRVIKIVENKVTEVKIVLNNYVFQSGETESSVGEIGQIKQPDGTFINDPTPPPIQAPTLEERLIAAENAIAALMGV